MRYYAAADIHGFLSPFQDALRVSGYFEDEEEKKLVLCGDLFDRGEETLALQDYILGLLEADQVVLVRGNHEDLFCSLVTEDRGLPYWHHIQNGTYQTALDLTGYDTAMADIRHFDFAEEARNTPFYQKIIPSMVDYYETERYVFVHGWIPFRKGNPPRFDPDWRSGAWKNARWQNGMDAARAGILVEGKTIVCGHWHCSYGHSCLEGKCTEFGPDADFSPYSAPGILALDACTAHSGKVNVVCLED